ncbi:serine hydrolase domain-containing protein [Aquabacterium sp. OR-4]|uniref:serine hydrolase domain-containing protein n=1 Tax=Aquabacterium sp. OR-4 TaxID=2978127 RepID=UPI0028CA299F|nr:serine hydrolase [Aquabacterium sp. OR-4]MDT7835711.1 serine hydrolase [Aquabacterium sp. OR-4]
MNAPVALLQALKFPDAQASCPVALGWMQGSPPPAPRRIRFDDGSAYRFPQLRWSFSHLDHLVPVTEVARSPVPVWQLPRQPRDDIDGLGFQPVASRQRSHFAQAMAEAYTDGVLVLHRGRIVHERYHGALQAAQRHTAMSVTKSVVGLLAAMLVHEGALDEYARVSHYLPSLAGTGFADATVGQLMDMTSALDYSEDYTDPQAGIWRHARAGGVLPRPPGYDGPQSLAEFLHGVGPAGQHGQAFGYRTVNTDALAMVMQSVTGQDLATHLAERLWRRLGAEHEAFFTVDSQGMPFAGGGLNSTLRDLARLGEMLRCHGWADGRQLVPEAVILRIRAGGCPETFARARQPQMRGWSYRAMWWVTHNAHGAWMARGVHGQALYIDPRAEMVVARLASHPLPASLACDPSAMRAWAALGQHLIDNP